MKNEKDVRLAMGRCFQAQKDDNPELCPMYPGEEFLDCYNCTCCDVFNWLLEDVSVNGLKAALRPKCRSGTSALLNRWE